MEPFQIQLDLTELPMSTNRSPFYVTEVRCRIVDALASTNSIGTADRKKDRQQTASHRHEGQTDRQVS